MSFKSRIDAAIQLEKALARYKQQNAVILTPPDGSMIIANYLAEELGATLDILMAALIHHPLRRQEIVGAVSLDDCLLGLAGHVSENYLLEVVPLLRRQLMERYNSLTGGKQPVNIEGETVIVVTQGIASGNKLLPSLALLREMRPAKLVVAAPVAATEAIMKIKPLVDEFVCLLSPMPFYDTAYFYHHFPAVREHELRDILIARKDGL